VGDSRGTAESKQKRGSEKRERGAEESRRIKGEFPKATHTDREKEEGLGLAGNHHNHVTPSPTGFKKMSWNKKDVTESPKGSD